MEIGKSIRRLRLQRGLTQEELANRCELSKGFISLLERDLTSPSVDTLTDVLESLGTDLKTFFSDTTDDKIVFTDADMFEKEDEETIILFYGDHQPSLSNIASKFYLLNDDSPQKEQQAKYVVPYLFWANYPIECERATPLTSINYLSSWLLDMTGVGGTDFDRFVKKTNEEIMAINSMGWMDYDLKFHETDYVNQNYSDLLKLYSHLQYNAMYDKEHKLSSIFGIK